MRIAVLGGNGQLGTDVCRAFKGEGDQVIPLTHNDIQIENLESVQRMFEIHDPEIIVNTAAMHQVDRCEVDPEAAFKVNAIGARNLAVEASRSKALLIHVSTDYVFDGKKTQPYLEGDEPMPLNAYGISKLAAEHFVRGIAAKHFILRVSGLYGLSPCRAKGGLNFVELMLKLSKEREELRVVDSEMLTPTPTIDVARQITKLKSVQHYGLYHATAEGGCSWFEFAQEIFRLMETSVKLAVAHPNEFPTKTLRPKYSVLENYRLKALGLNVFQPWQVGLRQYLAMRPASIASAALAVVS